MQQFQAELISLVKEKEITSRDAALIILSKDGLKPLSSVGFYASPKLKNILSDYKIPFTIRGGRVHVGNMAKKKRYSTQNGMNFGFPKCCSSLFLNTNHLLFSKPRQFSSGVSPYVFHVPCSEKCKETSRLAQKYMAHVKQNYPLMAHHIKKNLC